MIPALPLSHPSLIRVRFNLVRLVSWTSVHCFVGEHDTTNRDSLDKEEEQQQQRQQQEQEKE